ncbi:MAG: response regulator [Candidatus Margulisiibacteriota bacterium]
MDMDKKRILIVDDEEDFGALVKLSLESSGGYIVEHETKGTNALQTARAFNPDLILLDIMMPDLSGNRVADQLKLDNELGDIPLIILTATVKEYEVEDTVHRFGGCPCLAKPISVEHLVESIEENIR